MRMPERVVADGSTKVSTGNASTSCTWTARLRPRARSRIVRASRSARPLFTTAAPIVSTPTRKYGTGLANPCSAARIVGVAPLSGSRVTASSAVTPGSSVSLVHSTIAISITSSALAGERQVGDPRRQPQREAEDRQRGDDGAALQGFRYE